jgi:hypothetical protein
MIAGQEVMARRDRGPDHPATSARPGSPGLDSNPSSSLGKRSRGSVGPNRADRTAPYKKGPPLRVSLKDGVSYRADMAFQVGSYLLLAFQTM